MDSFKNYQYILLKKYNYVRSFELSREISSYFFSFFLEKRSVWNKFNKTTF